MRILVTGSRNWTDRWAMEGALGEVIGGDPAVILHGDADGADALASYIIIEWAKDCGIWGLERFPADWDKHGKAAGPIRNAQMLTEGKPDICLAFPLPGSKGTWDMIRKANEAGIEVRIIPPSKEGEK